MMKKYVITQHNKYEAIENTRKLKDLEFQEFDSNNYIEWNETQYIKKEILKKYWQEMEFAKMKMKKQSRLIAMKRKIKEKRMKTKRLEVKQTKVAIKRNVMILKNKIT